MKLAAAEGMRGMRKNHGGPFGAVIVRTGRVVAKGHNEVIKTKDPTAHAEIVVIRRASAKLQRFDLSDCEIYTTCEPCPMCLYALYWARIQNIYFGCTRRDAEKIGFRDKLFYDLAEKKNGRLIKRVQIGRAGCLELFREWERKKDKVTY